MGSLRERDAWLRQPPLPKALGGVLNSDVSDPSKGWYQKAVAEGIWLYDGSIERAMYVIEQNYDYFHSMHEADGMLEDAEKPKLNSDGKVFFLYFGSLEDGPPFSVSEMKVGLSKQEVMDWAEKDLSYFQRWLP